MTFFRTMYKSIYKMFLKNNTNTNLQLGRWNLKHSPDKLNLFYSQIPDPGYTIKDPYANIDNKKTNV